MIEFEMFLGLGVGIIIAMLFEVRMYLKAIHSAVLDHHFYYGRPEED